MLKGLFKPRWQSNNPAIRLKGLKSLTGNSEELIKLAQNDPDTTVRTSAIQSLQHLSTLATLAAGVDSSTQQMAKKRLTELALSHSVDEQELATAYPLIDDVSVHTKIASDTKKSTAVRKQALHHISDQKLFFALAKSDPSKEIQFLAAAQLTDFQQIKTLEKLTQNNKKLRQLLKERAKEYQEKEDKLAALTRICDEISGLGNTEKWEQDKTRFLVLQQQWKNSPAELTEKSQKQYDLAIQNYNNKLATQQAEDALLQPLRNNFQTIIQTLINLTETLKQTTKQTSQNEIDEIILAAEQSWISLKSQLPEDEVLTMNATYTTTVEQLKTYRVEFNKIQTSLKQFQHLKNKAEQLNNSKKVIQQKQLKDLQQQWQQLKAPIGLDTKQLTVSFKNTINVLQAKLQKQTEQNEAKLSKIQHTLDKMEAEISADQLGKAIKTYHSISTQIRNAQQLPKQKLSSVKQRLSAATEIVKSAQDWRHWGTDKAREQLIEQTQALCDDQSIKPTKRATEIKTLRDDWKRLGKMDPSQHQKLWEQFDATCSKAYEPCQQYFKEESNTRKDNLQQRQNVCKQLQRLEKETDWKTVDWKEISKNINVLKNKWKKVGSVDRAEWNNINEQFNAAMDALEVHLSNERRVNWARRENLVKQAKALISELESSNDTEVVLPSLIEQAKTLQSQWQPTVTASRSEEKKLWEQFRGAIDSLFNLQREKYNANRDELKQNLQNKQSLLKEAESLVKLTGDDLLTAKSQIVQLEERFNTITALPKAHQSKGTETKFDQAKNKLTEKVVEYHQKKRLEQLILLSKKAKICATQEVGKSVKDSWDAVDKLDSDKLEKQIQQRFENTTENHLKENAERLSALTLEIEILLELETPKEYQQDRMKLQVERLSEQMLSTIQSQISNKETALQKIQDWYLVSAIPSEMREGIDKRFSQIEEWIKTQ